MFRILHIAVSAKSGDKKIWKVFLETYYLTFWNAETYNLNTLEIYSAC